VTLARPLDGKGAAAAIRAEVAGGVAILAKETGLVPRLAVVLVGENPASRIYVRNKARACREAGMEEEILDLDARTTQAALLGTLERLNRDPAVHGILLQLPLPAPLDAKEAILALSPAKDVDGLHPDNSGRLLAGLPGFVPCTPAGVVEILRRNGVELAGREAVVIGRSDIVGKPVALLLLREHCTVSVCHSRTREIAAVARRADILVAAIGRPAFVTGDFIKPGAIVVDVGINRCTSLEDAARFWPGDAGREREIRERGSTLVGDVHPREAAERASMLTPVPGGIGPMTIAMLLVNTLRAARIAARGHGSAA
jgi:methylenetetrahydrofolate dehydrogenase (NADP+)/methenyltetrahydrofolate cyclohydrolase